MVKQLAAKRTDKSLTVEDFWSIRESLKAKIKVEKPINPLMQERVQNRFRFQRQKNLVRQFNPLAILLQNRIVPEQTHTELLLSNITTMPRAISKVRSMCLSLPLILHNLPIILKILTDNLDVDDSWSLMMGIVRDTGVESFDVFLADLGKLTIGIEQGFDNSRFRKLFDTVAVFLESNFQKVKSNLRYTWNVFRDALFSHPNKYVRRFALQSFSYILGKIPHSALYQFYDELIDSAENAEQISWAMFHEYQVISGYLTHLSAEKFGALWEHIYKKISHIQEIDQQKEEQINAESLVSSSRINHYLNTLACLLEHLSDRLTLKINDSNDITFNLCDILKIASTKSVNHLKETGNVDLIVPIIRCMQHTLDNNKYAKSNVEINGCLATIIKEGISYQQNSTTQFAKLLGLYLHNCKDTNKDKYYKYLKGTTITNRMAFLDCLIEHTQKQGDRYRLSQALVNLLALVFKDDITRFMSNGIQQEQTQQLIQLISKLCLIFKKSEFNEKIRLDKLDIKEEILQQKLVTLQKMFNSKGQFNTEVLDLLLTLLKLLKYVDLNDRLLNEVKTVIVNMNTIFNGVLTKLFGGTSNSSDQEGDEFNLGKFIMRMCANSDIIPTVTFILSFKEFVMEFGQCHQINLFSKDELQFQWLLNSRYSLVSQISHNNKISHSLLSSRRREVRHSHLSAMGDQNELVIALRNIDSQEVDLHTEREVKRQLSDLLRIKLSRQDTEMFAYWCIGFAYTGFKLVEQTVVKVLSELLTAYPQIVCPIVFKQIQYINMKLSRKFPEALNEFISHNTTFIDLYCNSHGPIVTLLNHEYPPANNQVSETVGFERIATALQQSETGRTRLQNQLYRLLSSYFKYEFNRSNRLVERTVEDSHYQGQTPLKLLPPHPVHLQIMMKLLPNDFLPEYDVLHYSHDFLRVYERLNVKTTPWEKIWEKKSDDQTHYTLRGKLSIDEQHLYQHFLWKIVLESDERKRQRVFEYLRSELDVDIEYFLSIHLNQIYFTLDEIKTADCQKILNKIRLIPEKLLVSFLRITASFLTIFKMSIRHLVGDIANFVVLITQFSYSDQVLSIQSKLFRRTCAKTLTVLYREFSMFPQLIQKSAQDLLKIVNEQLVNLQTSTTSSVPTLLKVLLQWSANESLQFLFNRPGMLLSISCIYSQSSKKEAIELVSNLFGHLYRPNMQNNQPIVSTLKKASDGILKNFSTYFVSLKVPSINAVSLLSEILNYSKEVPEQVCSHCISVVTNLTSNRKKQQKYKQTIQALLGTLVAVASKSLMSEDSYSKIMLLIPQVQVEFKQSIIAMLNASQNNRIRSQIHEMAHNLNSTVQKGLEILPDYDRIFASFRSIGDGLDSFTRLEKEYIMLNLITMIASQELSVKSASVSLLDKYLNRLTLQDMPQFKLLYKTTIQLMRINGKDQTKFFSCLAVVGLFLQTLKRLKYKGVSSRDIGYERLGVCDKDADKNFFKLVTSISQNSKLKAINLLRNNVEKLAETNMDVQSDQDDVNKNKHDLPNIITGVLIPTMEQLIFSKSKGNLSSSLSLASTRVEGQLFGLLSESELKKQIKRIIMKINFKDTHSKSNVLLMKLINEILDHINMGKSVLITLKEQIAQSGLEVLRYQKDRLELEQPEDQEDQLEEVNQKYIRLDRKMIAAEQDDEPTDPLVNFMRKSMLVPLKSMLFYESRSSLDEAKQSTSRLFLAVVLTKVLIRFPLRVFLIEFNKIVNKLSRMLKKKNQQVRDSARKCLSQIVKLTGAPLLHTVFRQMAFHLNQNFQKHIYTYSVHYIISELADQPEVVDYCLPLILPCAYQDIFGQSSNEKDLIDTNQIMTLVFEAKKRKGFELLGLTSRLLSAFKIEYLIQSLRGELRKQLLSEDRLSKFETVINSVVSGLSKNTTLKGPEQLIPLLNKLIKESSEKLRPFELNQGLTETTVKSELKKQKSVTKEQVLTIQDEAGRGASIFRKVNREIMNKRNNDQLAACLCNLHLSLVLMALKRGLLTEQISSSFPEELERIVSFVVDCLQNNNNVVLIKALKITSELLKWSSASSVHNHKKAIATQVLTNLDRLTSTEKELARQCMIIVNLVVKESAIPHKLVGPLLSHIKLHMQEDTRQPYELLKTLLLKHTKHPDMKDILQTVKQNMVMTYRDDIRKASKGVYACYLRNIGLNQKQKQSELMFLMKNADYTEETGRLVVMEMLQEMLSLFDQKEIEHYAEIMFMTLLTVYSSEESQQVKGMVNALQHKLLKSINKAKVQLIVEQGICWAKQDIKAIKLNGFNTFKLVGADFGELLTTKATEIIPAIKQQILDEAERLRLHLDDTKERVNQKNRLKDESSWNNIISSMVNEPQLQKSSCLTVSLELATYFKGLLKDEAFVKATCLLCSYPEKNQHIAAINAVQAACNINISYVSQYIPNNLTDLSRTITELRSHESIKFVVALIYKAYDTQSFELVEALLVMLRRAVHHSTVTYQLIQKNKNKQALEFMSRLLLKLLEDGESASILARQQWRTIIVQTASKLINQKDTLGEDIYQSVDKFVEALKQSITPTVFYEMTAQLKTQRIEKNQARKSALQQLAITDPQQYHLNKRANNKKPNRSKK